MALQVVEFVLLRRNKILQGENRSICTTLIDQSGSSLANLRRTSGKYLAALSLTVKRLRVKRRLRRTQASVDRAPMRSVASQGRPHSPCPVLLTSLLPPGSSLVILPMMSASSHAVQRLKDPKTKKDQRPPKRQKTQKFQTTADNVRRKRLELAGDLPLLSEQIVNTKRQVFLGNNKRGGHE